MNATAQPTITIQHIFQTIDSNPLRIEVIRETLNKSIGARLSFSGTVEKKITRHEHLKLFVRHDFSDGKTMMIFAEFTEPTEADKINAAKIRKGSKVSIMGYFHTVGYCAATMDHCRII